MGKLDGNGAGSGVEWSGARGIHVPKAKDTACYKMLEDVYSKHQPFGRTACLGPLVSSLTFTVAAVRLSDQYHGIDGHQPLCEGRR